MSLSFRCVSPLIAWALPLLAAGFSLSAAAPPPSEGAGAGFQQSVQPFLAKHCTACHGGNAAMAGLNFEAFSDAEAAREDPQVWERVQKMLGEGRMPPEGRPRPKAAETGPVLQWIETELKRLARDRPPDPGRVTARRLNRAEYNNTIRDLVGVDFRPADDFPADDTGYGFDNIGDVLSLSPVLMERYLAAAEQIAERAIVAEPYVEPTLDRYLAPRAPEESALEKPNPVPYSREGSIRFEHPFPANGEYELQVRWVDRRQIPKPEPGNLNPPMPEPLPFEISVDGERIEVVEIPPGAYADRQREVMVALDAGLHTIEASFLVDVTKIPDHDAEKYDKPRRMAFLDRAEVHGPFSRKSPPLTASHKKVFVCGHLNWPHQPGCPQQILGNLARNAYRRPVGQDEINALKRLVRLAQESGDSFEQGIQLALKAVLVSPHFLFRIEQDPDPNDPRAAHPVNQYELASRLSYFLWSSMPDDRLLQRATDLVLRDPEVMEAEVTRMLADPKSRALVENFAGQWLELRNLDLAAPDPDRFPDFDQDLRTAMRRETELFFETVMHEDRSIVDLLDGRFSFLNERLAKHYGIDGVDGSKFRRVSLEGGQRSGILTQASILTISSYPTRTSPVLRGKWLLDNILGEPPPPPPAAMDLDESNAGSAQTLREQLEQHRVNPSCAVCHVKMDALGFGLENYDAIGRWRTHDRELPLDTSGELPGGHSFTSPSELKAILRLQRDEFARCLTEKMLTYALGRGLESYDRPVVEGIAGALAEDDYRFSRLVIEIVKSRPFQMRRGEGSKP